MKITSIEEQKKHKERASVFVDGQFSFGAHIDVLLDFGLRKDVELDEEKITEIKTADAFRTAYDKAVGFLARRPRSEQEVRQYLRDKLIYHHPEYEGLTDSDQKAAFIDQQQESIEKILERLGEQGFVDDVAFAKWWIQNRQQFRPRGKRLLLLELKTKGLSNADIEAALTTPSETGHFTGEASEESDDENSELAMALGLAKKYAAKHQGIEERELKVKLSRYLASKGFEWEVIDQTWRELQQAKDS